MNKTILFALATLLLLSTSCKRVAKSDEADEKSNTITPVKITNPETGSISDYLELNATSSFLRKESIKSVANGFIKDIRITIGDQVHKGEVLFTIQTKESKALDNYKNTIDTSLHFLGIIPVLSNRDGIVSAITHQKGDYVQDGEQLATIAEQESLVFLIDAPYEDHQYLIKDKGCTLILPDGQNVPATIASDLPIMDVNNQTQNYLVKPSSAGRIPEGLIARVHIRKREKSDATTLPKGAVLSDEKEENFWIMKLINDSVAVKIPVKLGMQDESNIEIVSPPLQSIDRILISGNFGLDDTAKVKITK